MRSGGRLLLVGEEEEEEGSCQVECHVEHDTRERNVAKWGNDSLQPQQQQQQQEQQQQQQQHIKIGTFKFFFPSKYLEELCLVMDSRAVSPRGQDPDEVEGVAEWDGTAGGGDP